MPKCPSRRSVSEWQDVINEKVSEAKRTQKLLIDTLSTTLKWERKTLYSIQQREPKAAKNSKKALQNQAKVLEHREKACQNREREIQHRERMLEDRTKMIEDREKACQNWELMGKDRTKMIESQAKMVLEDREKACQNREGEIQHRERMVEDRTEMIEAQAKMVEDREKACQNREREIQHRERMVEDRTEMIEAQAKMVEDREKACQNREREISIAFDREKATLIASLDREIENGKVLREAIRVFLNRENAAKISTPELQKLLDDVAKENDGHLQISPREHLQLQKLIIILLRRLQRKRGLSNISLSLPD